MDSYQFNYAAQTPSDDEVDARHSKSHEKMKEFPYEECKNCMYSHNMMCQHPMMHQPMVSPYEGEKNPNMKDPMYGDDPYPMMYDDDPPPMMYGHFGFERPYHRPFHHFHHHVHHHFFHNFPRPY